MEIFICTKDEIGMDKVLRTLLTYYNFKVKRMYKHLIAYNDSSMLMRVHTFNRDASRVHPTQKPVSLLEWLIKTYTNEGMTVLDNCMGSGSTGVACANTNRNFHRHRT